MSERALRGRQGDHFVPSSIVIVVDLARLSLYSSRELESRTESYPGKDHCDLLTLRTQPSCVSHSKKTKSAMTFEESTSLQSSVSDSALRSTDAENAAFLSNEKSIHSPRRRPFQQSQRNMDDVPSSQTSSVAATAVAASDATDVTWENQLYVGARCCCRYDDGNDFFSTQVSKRAGGWHLAVISRIEGDTVTITFPADGSTEEFTRDDFYKGSEVRVMVHKQAAGKDVWYARERKLHWTLFLEARFQTLHPGDLVWGRFQNGDVLFRGRVGNVVRRGNQSFCDILYDDGDREFNIPFGPNVDPPNLIRQQRGRQNPEWLKGLSVKMTSMKNPNRKQGIVVGFDISESTVHVQYQQGQESYTEQRDYSSVTYSVIEHRIQELRKGKKFREYAWVSIPQTPSRSRPSGSQHFSTNTKQEASSTKDRLESTEPKATTSLQHARSNNNKSKTVNTNGSRGVKDKFSDQQIKKPKATTSRKRAGGSDFFTMIRSETTNLSPTYDTEEGVEPSLSQSYNRAMSMPVKSSLTHTAPDLGTDILESFVNVFNLQPPDDVWIFLIRLMVHGPEYDGVEFPDCQRMELAFEAITYHLKKPGMKNFYAQKMDRNYWRSCLERVRDADYYIAPGDERRTTYDAFLRIHQSVQAKACCIETFQIFLKHKVQGCMQSRSGGLADLCRNEPILRDIVGDRGSKGALELAVSTYASQWIKLGHFWLGRTLALADSAECKELLRSTFHQVCRLFEALGDVCSYMAWLHGVTEHESPENLARIMANVFSREMNQNKFDVSPFIGEMSKQDYREKVRDKLSSTLNESVIPEAKELFARKMGVEQAYTLDEMIDILGG